MAYILIFIQTNKKMKDLDFEMFLGFLKDESIYRQYIRNLIRESGLYSLDKLKEYIYFYSETVFINYAFDWDETNEGGDFWNNVNYKWMCELIKHIGNVQSNRMFKDT